MTTIRRIVTSKIDGSDANNTTDDEIRPFGEINVYIDNNNADKLVLAIHDGVRTHLKSKVLEPGVFYGSGDDSGDGAGLDTIKLIPDSELHYNSGNYNNDQYIIVDPTQPNHIHIRAGGTQDDSGADLYLGGELTNVRVSDSYDDVRIRTTVVSEGETTYDWTFDNAGNLTLPNDAVIRTDGSNVEIGGVANFNVEASGVVNIYTDTNGETPYQWQFGDDGSLTLPGDIHGAPLLSPGPTPSQIGRIVNITPADDANDKAFRFSIDQLGETFSRAYLQLPEAEVDKQVAAVFPHSNNTAGYIFTQGTNTNDDGMNDAFNIFYNNGDIKITSMDSLGGLYTWKFGDDGALSLPANGVIKSSTYSGFSLRSRHDEPIDNLVGSNILISPGQVSINYQVEDQGVPTPGYQWDFNYVTQALDLADGGLKFADNTVQTTAWTGTGTADTGNVTFDDNTIQGNTLGTVGTQITVNSNYLGVTTQNSNVFNLSKTADTDQVQIGWIIRGSGGGPQTITNKIDSGGYWSFYVAGGISTAYPITIESSDYQLGGGAQLILAVDPGDSSVKSWTFDSDGSITFPDASVQTTAYVPEDNLVKVSGEWTVTAGTNTYSFTVPGDGTYVMWVKGNIPNGIITWNATASVSNTNVPTIGTQYAWNYTGGGSPILLTSIPNQIVGSAGTISTDNTYVGTTSNRFDFGISNTSGSTQTIYYGYTKIS